MNELEAARQHLARLRKELDDAQDAVEAANTHLREARAAWNAEALRVLTLAADAGQAGARWTRS